MWKSATLFGCGKATTQSYSDPLKNFTYFVMRFDVAVDQNEIANNIGNTRGKTHFDPSTPRTIENQEAPSSEITRHYSRALVHQQCQGQHEKRLLLIKIKC